jgi:hypothetical protein
VASCPDGFRKVNLLHRAYDDGEAPTWGYGRPFSLFALQKAHWARAMNFEVDD